MSKTRAKISLKGALKEIKAVNILMLFIAGIINSFGVTMFLFPVKLYDSGISGLSMLLVKNIVHDIDKGAFISLQDVADIVKNHD